MSRISAHRSETIAYSGGHVEPVNTACEAAIADGEEAGIPVFGQEEAEAEGRGWRRGDVDLDCAEGFEAGGGCWVGDVTGW